MNTYGTPAVTKVGMPASRRPAKPSRRQIVQWAGDCRRACDVHGARQVAAIMDDYFKALGELAAAEQEVTRLRAETFDVPTQARAPSPVVLAACERTGDLPIRGVRR